MKKGLLWCYFSTIFILLITATSCQKENDFIVKGYKPVYKTMEDIRAISIHSNRPLVDPGKIYIYEEKIFILEKDAGIHIYDNSNPFNPIGEHFISVPMITDIAIKEDILYANNGSDFVAIDITSLPNIEIVYRMKNIFSIPEHLQHPNKDCWFECVDTEKGIVVDWIETELTNPKCYRGINPWEYE